MPEYYLGIDGGGSNLRVALVTPELELVAESYGGGVNPSAIGLQASASAIQAAMREVLASISPEQVKAVGIGIAGAAVWHSVDWLVEVVKGVLPATQVVPSSDIEIALVGAHGRRSGILLLAGTGSIAYGINEKGETTRAGGWGYLIGDEGSGYWIGKTCLNLLTAMSDGRQPPNEGLTDIMLQALELPTVPAIVGWLYHANVSRTREIAALAPLVIERAQAGDNDATAIVEQAAAHLYQHAKTLMQRLDMEQSSVAFAGGLLTHRNLLTERLCALLQLETLPQTRYSPVIGAALLAKLASK